jgi:hypothetical protein
MPFKSQEDYNAYMRKYKAKRRAKAKKLKIVRDYDEVVKEFLEAQKRGDVASMIEIGEEIDKQRKERDVQIQFKYQTSVSAFQAIETQREKERQMLENAHKTRPLEITVSHGRTLNKETSHN